MLELFVKLTVVAEKEFSLVVFVNIESSNQMKTLYFVQIMKSYGFACLLINQVELMAISNTDLVVCSGPWAVHQCTDDWRFTHVQFLRRVCW